jgi:flagellar P-ring protein FlgI
VRGGRIDITVSAIGDAKSLLGGTLVMTPLTGADGQIYAVAQGTIIAGGISAQGAAGGVVQGVPTAGVVPSGARVERDVNGRVKVSQRAVQNVATLGLG